ncbi:MAG: TonB-dependent receptor, partial [Pseudomonadota bacterium]
GSPTPEVRYTAGVQYLGDNLNARLSYRYIDSFTDDQNDVEIDSFDTIDAQVGYNFGENYTATLCVTNLTDEDPPVVFTNGGFESRTHDPRGRVIYLQLGAEF